MKPSHPESALPLSSRFSFVRIFAVFYLAAAVVLTVSCGKKKAETEEGADTAVEQKAEAEAGEGTTETMAGKGPESAGADAASAPKAAAVESEPESGSDPKMAVSSGGTEGRAAYVTPMALVTDLTEALKANDVAKFLKLVGASQATEQVKTLLSNLFLKRRYQIDQKQPSGELAGDAANKSTRINVVPPSNLAFLGAQAIQVDLKDGGAAGWQVTGVKVPDIEAVAAAYLESGDGKGKGVAGTAIEAAESFLEAVVKRDFGMAKAVIDSERLSDEKLAALFIVVEDGSFKAHDEKPLVATAARDNSAWVIARLRSDKEESDFGIEMERGADGTPWKVVGLNFSKLIQTAAVAAGAGDVAYAPMKTDLQDGDQLVLYFEFDDVSVNPRAARQLKIIADILAEDKSRSIHINGHADAKGQPSYNLSLGEGRAEQVRQTLIAHGIPANQIVTKSYGDTAPKAPNVNPDGTDNPTGRAQNRRAEVHLEF